MTVLEDIRQWSVDRPAWQRDALRRLVLNGELSDDDVSELTDICKRAHGLAEQQDIAPLTSKGAGVCAEEVPWVAMPIKKKIGYLKNEWQAADKLFRDDHQDAYEKEAISLYDFLRKAWERALEEVLLGGVVERYRPGVQTQHIATIADITGDDCRTIDAAMTKCSKWLHDQAAAARAPVPEPGELKADIEALENWVAAIRSRRR